MSVSRLGWRPWRLWRLVAAYVELSRLEAEIGGFGGPGGPGRLLSNFPSFWPCMHSVRELRKREVTCIVKPKSVQ